MKQKRQTCQLVDFKSETKDERKRKLKKYLDLAGKLKKLWNISVIVIPLLVGTLGTIHKGLEKRKDELEIRGRLGIVKATVLLVSARKLRRVLDCSRDSLSLTLRENYESLHV